MSEPLRIYIGFDDREAIAYHVLSHSIITRASGPVSITPIKREHLKEFTRPRSESESTDFSFSRFLTPYLAGNSGLAIFMDCDMLCLADIWELLEFQEQQPFSPVLVCQHDYTPRSKRKFLGHAQAAYPRKNWSSMMLFNLQHYHCKRLTPELVNKESGKFLHRFEWTDGKIGALPLEWNYLVGEPNQTDKPPKIVHWTNGGPWFEEYSKTEYSDLWRDEVKRMAQGVPSLCAT
jgi:hypothetical protein